MINKESIHQVPELMYLSPTTRERALLIAQELLSHENMEPVKALRKAVLIAKNWAVKNINRKVWKKIKFNESEIL